MPLIGQGSQPAAIDYSSFSESAWQLANSNSRAIGKVTDQAKDIFDKRKKDKESVKTGQAKLDAAIELFGDQGGYLAGVRDKIADEDLPISDRAALAGTANELLALGIDKMNTDRQFAIQDRGLQLEERRITEGSRQFDEGMQVEQYQAQTQQDFANETAKEEGTNRMIAAQELVTQFKLPGSPAMQERFQQAIESGNGASVKSVADEYLAMVRPQAEAASKGGGSKLTSLNITMPDGRPGEMNVFDDGQGGLKDIYGRKLNPEAFLPEPGGEGMVLPPRDDVPQGSRVPAMPKTVIGSRPMVSPNETPEQALAKSRMTGADARLTETLKSSETLAGTLDNLNQTESLLDEVRTGFGAESIMKAKRMFGADVANAEQLQTLLGDQVMARVAQTKGAVSEKEMDLFQQFSANFGKTPDGNKRIIQFAKKAATRAKKISKAINDGFQSGKTPFEIQAQIIEIQTNEPISDALSPPSGKMDDEDDATSRLRAFGQ